MKQLIDESSLSKPSPLNSQTVDYGAIKGRQQTTWASGDYAKIGLRLQIVGETLAEAVDIRANDQVLDVAAGNGNATLAAARRYANVTSTDYVQALLDNGAVRARAEGFDIRFEVADVENLPYADGSFDVVLSTYGVMFTPQHKRAADEMVRVLRSGGRIGLANWTPEGFIGELFRLMGTYIPPAPGLEPATLWGTEPHIVHLFGSNAADIRCERRMFNFRFKSAAHWIEIFRNYYGPMHKAYSILDPERQAELTQSLTELLERNNVGGPSSLVVPGEYLEVVITVK